MLLSFLKNLWWLPISFKSRNSLTWLSDPFMMPHPSLLMCTAPESHPSRPYSGLHTPCCVTSSLHTCLSLCLKFLPTPLSLWHILKDPRARKTPPYFISASRVCPCVSPHGANIHQHVCPLHYHKNPGGQGMHLLHLGIPSFYHRVVLSASMDAIVSRREFFL